MSDIRHRLAFPALREAISQHEIIIDGIGVPCPMQRPRIREESDLSRSRSEPGGDCFPRQGWLIVRPRTVARSTHSIEFGAWV
jgi:hypothetical protein